MYKNINNLHNHHNSISYWWSKSVTSWSTCDLIGCINSIDLPSNWRDMSIKLIHQNQLNGLNISKLKSAKKMGKMLEITNPMLYNKLFREIKKYSSTKNDRMFTSYKVNPAFKLNIFSQNEHMKLDLNEKCTKSVLIKDAIKLFQQKANTAANIDDILFYARGNLLNNDNTLEQENITDERHLITVKFAVGAGREK
eukprot:10138_1